LSVLKSFADMVSRPTTSGTTSGTMAASAAGWVSALVDPLSSLGKVPFFQQVLVS
jgi:hypothetical protein